MSVMTDISLKGKTALITGASKGIGAAVAKAYASKGAHVILLARNVSGLEKVDNEIREAGGQATLMPFDLNQLDELEKLGPVIHDRFGGLDILVANAGMLGTLKPLPQISMREFQQVLQTNVTANFQLIRTLDPLLRSAEAGRAIFVTTSGQVTNGRAYWGTYALSKAALDSMVRVYADETRQTNLRVNLIDPGSVRTDMRASAKPGENPETLTSPDDVAELFIKLTSPSLENHGEVFRFDELSD